MIKFVTRFHARLLSWVNTHSENMAKRPLQREEPGAAAIGTRQLAKTHLLLQCAKTLNT